MRKKLRKSPDEVVFAVLGALAIAERGEDEFFQSLVEEGKQSVLTHSQGSANELRAIVLAAVEEIRQSPESVSARRKQSPPMDIQTVRARQAQRLEAARRAFIEEFGTVEEPDGDYARLKQERRIFSVSYEDKTYLPSFQFDERGDPLPAVAAVIQTLGAETSDWGLALWFTASDGWLGGRRPVDLLHSEPERVVQAAEQEAAELVF
jgi:hypothetical protein